MSKTTSDTKRNTKQLSKNNKSFSTLFQNRIIFQKILSYLPKKEKFILFNKSKALLRLYDIKIEDSFIPRKYQEKIKNYKKNYEDLFYKIILDIKKDKEKNGQKICLYEIENKMVKYLKYLTVICDKIITISLINVNDMEIWKLDFISKLLENLEKNVHLKLSLNFIDIRDHEIFRHICSYSKAINILEIVDFFKTHHVKGFEEIIPYFNWKTMHKIIININEFEYTKFDRSYINKSFLIHLLNTINTPNLEEFELRCDYINLNNLEKFFEKNGKTIKKLHLDNYTIFNDIEVDNNTLLNYLSNINELSLIIDENNLERIFCFFYPIFPKIKKFNLVINDNKEQIENQIKEIKDKIVNTIKKEKSENKFKKRNKTKENLTKKKTEKNISNFKLSINQLNYMSEVPNLDFEKLDSILDDNINEDFVNSRNINLRKINFTSDKKEMKKIYNKRLNVNSDLTSTLSNLNNCESLKYEIRTNNSYFSDKQRINALSYLINVLEINKNNLHYLELYINNNELESINIYDFELLIKTISKCKKLNTFIFDYELNGEFATLFNNLFNIGNNLTHLSLVHRYELDVTKIIGEHKNLANIKLELISENYDNFYFELDLNRNWESIDLTNYPISQSIYNFLKGNKKIKYFLDSCTNCLGLDEKNLNDLLKNSGENTNDEMNLFEK